MNKPTIQQRILKPLFISAAIIWCVSTLATVILTHQAVTTYFDEALKETAERVLPMALDDYFSSQAAVRPENPISQFSYRDFGATLSTEEDHSERILYRLIDNQTERLVIRSHTSGPDAVGPITPGFYDIPGYRIYNEVTNDKRFTLQILEDEIIRTSTVLQLVVPIIITLTLAIPVFGFIITRITQRALQPLSNLSAVISKHNPADPENIHLDGLTSELESIQLHINHLLDKTRIVLERERYLASNLAHELRTPLAVVLGELQQIQDQLVTQDSSSVISGIKAQLQRMNRTADKLLELARSESADPANQSTANMLQIIRLLVSDLGFQPEQILIDIPDTIKVTTDIDAIGILIKNLLENAFRYSDSNEVIRVIWERGALIVQNTTRVISESDKAMILKRGVKLESRGHGLGLSIAETIAARLKLQFRIEIETVEDSSSLFRASVRFNS